MNKQDFYMVSVRLMTYNHEAFIAEAIQSVLNQKTNFQVELVIGDDFSTDKTLDIAKSFKSTRNVHINILNRKKGDEYWQKREKLGRLYNFVNIIENCSGKYIALLDGDDYWTDPCKLKKQVDFLETNPDCVSCHHWHTYAYLLEDGSYELGKAPTKNQGYLPQEKTPVKEIFANKLRVKTRTHLFRNIITDFPDWFFKISYGDVVLSMILGKYGKFGFIDEPMAVYRQTGVGASSVGKESHSYYYNHFLNWIKIWEYGINYYQYQYYEEAKGTLLYFYSFILKRYGFGTKAFSKLLTYAVFQSKIKISKRIGISLRLCMMFMINFLPSFLQRLKTKARSLAFRHA